MSSVTTYELGDRPLITVQFHLPETTTPVQPDEVALDIRKPDGSTTTYVHGVDEEIENPSTGKFTWQPTLDQAGWWRGRWYSTGDAQKSVDFEFVVDDSGALGGLDNEEIPISRRITMIVGPDGLVGNKTAYITANRDNPPFALDFYNEMAPGQQITAVDDPEVLEGEAMALTTATGKKHTQAKVKFSSSAVDEFVVQVTVHFGVGSRTGRVVVKAT